jgi:hypothetical protein
MSSPGKFIPLLLFLIFNHALVHSQASTKPELDLSLAKRSYTTTSVAGLEPIKIDGQINDPAWEAVDWTSGYVEFEPDNNTPPTQQTKMMISRETG